MFDTLFGDSTPNAACSTSGRRISCLRRRMLILAHRAYRNGPDAARENTLVAVVDCLREGWGVEIDIRRGAQGGFYIAHDPAPDRADAGGYCEAIRQHARAPIALNVKDLGYEADLLRLLDDHGIIDRVFLFDMELLERDRGRAAATFRALHPTVRIAARVSDRAEPIEQALAISAADVTWVDEFDRLWITEADVQTLKTHGKTVYAISPELHGFSSRTMIERWEQFAAWGVDGICTDFADRARAHLENRRKEAAS